MKKRIFIVMFLTASLVAIAIWMLSDPGVSVSDVQKAETIVLGQDTSSPRTYAISIRGSGQLEGEATISLLLNGLPYKVQKLSGTIDFEWRGDWYADYATVKYEPVNVRSGKVVLHYKFHRL